MYRKEITCITVIVTLCLSFIIQFGCKAKYDPDTLDDPDAFDTTADTATVTHNVDTKNVVSNAKTVTMSYDNIVGSKKNEFQKPRYSKLNTGESRYLVDSKDGLVSLELIGELTKVHTISIRFSATTSEIEQYAILLTVNRILANVLEKNFQFISSWHEDIMTRAVSKIANREVATMFDIVNGRRIEYKVWKTIGMVLITIQM